MREPKRIPLTDNPRNKEPIRIPLTNTEVWESHDAGCGPPILTKLNENNQENNSTSIQQLESDQID